MSERKLSGRELRRNVSNILKTEDIGQALDILCRMPARQAVNPLFSLLLSTDPELKWPAVTALGAVIANLAHQDMESARVMMRRLMWQLNDESGGIGWGCPETMGEAMACHEGLAQEYARVLASYVMEDGNFLEYEPLQYRDLLVPLIEDEADVVFGSRYLRTQRRKVLYFWHSWMNKTLTFISNMMTNLDISDMETCYKLFRREVIQSIDLKEDRFGFEPEVVAKIAQKHCRVWEVAIWSRTLIAEFTDQSVGEVVAEVGDGYIVKCRDGLMLIKPEHFEEISQAE